MVTGAFAMAIGFVGCIGAIKENKCLLLTFFVLLLLVFLLEATVAVLFLAYTEQIDRYAQRDLKRGLHLFGTPGNVGLTNAWSIVQTDFRCCGVSNYTDWFAVYNATRVPDSCCLEFSERCGLHAPGTWWKAPCYATVKVWLQENLLAVGIFGLCTALVQVGADTCPQREARPPGAARRGPRKPVAARWGWPVPSPASLAGAPGPGPSRALRIGALQAKRCGLRLGGGRRVRGGAHQLVQLRGPRGSTGTTPRGNICGICHPLNCCMGLRTPHFCVCKS
ncbi:PREDICTED: tetraspanin-4 [Condylura cristata]|uniref:tetraspanin-4 n=1 Tax=Condylura cristata TaxID=143302 RepID=UPI0006435294|nr:PREDICTED: tetraspanin-4 [Condylura cristata]